MCVRKWHIIEGVTRRMYIFLLRISFLQGVFKYIGAAACATYRKTAAWPSSTCVLCCVGATATAAAWEYAAEKWIFVTHTQPNAHRHRSKESSYNYTTIDNGMGEKEEEGFSVLGFGMPNHRSHFEFPMCWNRISIRDHRGEDMEKKQREKNLYVTLYIFFFLLAFIIMKSTNWSSQLQVGVKKN